MKNLARAKKDGLAREHLALIEDRIKLVKEEIAEGEAASAGGAGPETAGDVEMEVGGGPRAEEATRVNQPAA